MTALLIGLVVWAVLAWAGMAALVGVLLAGVIRERDRQVPAVEVEAAGCRTPDAV